MDIQFATFAATTIADATVNTSVTTINVASGDGALFPTLTGDQYFRAVMVTSAGARESIKVTARSSDAMTVVRGEESTTPLSFVVGDKFELRLVAAALDDAVAELSDAGTYVNNSDGSPNISSTTFDFVNIAHGAWETVGPTGSGADNIWTAMDSLPAETEWVEVRFYITGNGAVEGRILLIQGRAGDSSATNVYDTTLVREIYAPGGIMFTVPHAKIPVDSDLTFGIYRTDTDSGSYAEIITSLTGYGKNT